MKSIVSGSPARSTVRLTTVYMVETCQKQKISPILLDISFQPSATHFVRHYWNGATPFGGCSGHEFSSLYWAVRMWGDVRSPEGCRDGAQWAVEAELDRDGSADCMCLRVIPGSQQQQTPTVMVVLERHPHTKVLGGYKYIRRRG